MIRSHNVGTVIVEPGSGGTYLTTYLPYDYGRIVRAVGPLFPDRMLAGLGQRITHHTLTRCIRHGYIFQVYMLHVYCATVILFTAVPAFPSTNK